MWLQLHTSLLLYLFELKRIVSIATKGDRPEQLKRTIASLENQCDEVFVYDNTMRTDYTDNAKFWLLEELSEPCYYFTADDDLIYPSDYCQKTVEWIYKFGEIISYHGRILKEPIRSYYRGHTVYDFRGVNDRAMFLDVGGTGVMCFRTDIFKPDQIYKSEYKCMSDLVLSLEAKKQGRRIICPPHPQNWIIQQEVSGGIMSTFAKNEHQQIELAKQIYESK